MQYQPDFRPHPFWVHDKPIVVTIPGEPPACVIAFPECIAARPKQLLDGELKAVRCTIV